MRSPWHARPPLLALLLWGSLAIAAPPKVDPALRTALKEAIETSDSFADRFDAEVWLLDMSSRLEPLVKDPQERLAILRGVHREAQRVDLPPELMLAIIEVESRFDRFAISRAGAQGLMQVMPFWLKEIGHPGDSLFRLHTNLRMGSTILRHYLDREAGDLTRALMRYNGSVGSFRYTNRVFKALNRRWRRK